MKDTVVSFHGHKCWPMWQKYTSNNRLALLLEDAWGGTMAASVNVPNAEVREGEIAIKDYSENEGMLTALMEAGIVSAPLRYVRSGFVQIPICKVLGGEPAEVPTVEA